MGQKLGVLFYLKVLFCHLAIFQLLWCELSSIPGHHVHGVIKIISKQNIKRRRFIVNNRSIVFKDYLDYWLIDFMLSDSQIRANMYLYYGIDHFIYIAIINSLSNCGNAIWIRVGKIDMIRIIQIIIIYLQFL